jgi:hypothetical protein
MGTWTLARRLSFGFAVVLSITLGLGLLAWSQFVVVRRDADFIAVDALPGVYNIGRYEASLRGDVASLFDAITTDDLAHRQQLLNKAAADANEAAKLLTTYEASITRDEDRRLFDDLMKLRVEYRAARGKTLQFLSDGHPDAALDAMHVSLQPVLERYTVALSTLVDYNKRSADTSSSSLQRAVARGIGAAILGMLGALVVGAGAAWRIIRGIDGVIKSAVGELRTGSGQVAAAASQVAGSSQALSQGSSEQAASLEETSASMEEIASLTRKNAESLDRCAGMMAESATVVGQANVALTDMTDSMTRIGDSSREISKIIKTIDEIAFQTNLLALNAAVEAARAGDAGMGFAVVAGEVRNLAQRAGQAARDTTALIEESVERARQGHARVEHVADVMQAVTRSAEAVKALVDEMTVAAQQQAQGISQVSQAVVEMEKVTQSTAATAEEGAAASEELNAQAEAALAVVRRLESLAGIEAA